MRKPSSPIALRDAPLQYAPTNELGVVFVFAHIAKRLQLRIEEIRPRFPDCIAYRRTGDAETLVRIEFEFRSSSFRSHGHDATECDAIVCWHHDWPDVPEHLEVIELKRHFGVARKVWLQQAIKSQWEYLDTSGDALDWQLSRHATPGDIVLIYRCAPMSAITDVFVFAGECVMPAQALWRDGRCYGGEIHRLCRLASPVFLEDMRQHRVVQTASFVRRNMQGVSLLATQYWPYLYEMILERNPLVSRKLSSIRPDRL